jgi:hypothetical protein
MFNKKQKHIFAHVEDGYWMVMIVNKFDEKDGESSTKNSHEFFNNILMTAYNEFKMFYSPMEEIVQKTGVKELKKNLKEYFDNNINFLKTKIEKMEISDIFRGLSFIPVDSSVFLLIQSFLNQIMDKFENVKSGIFYYDESVIFSLIKHENVKICESIFRDAKIDQDGFIRIESKQVYFEDTFYFPIIYAGYKRIKILLLVDEEKDIYVELKKYLDLELLQMNEIFPESLNFSQRYFFLKFIQVMMKFTNIFTSIE